MIILVDSKTKSRKATRMELISLLIASAAAAYHSSLIGGGPEISHTRFRFFTGSRFSDSNPGEFIGMLVMETSTMFDRARDEERIGWLVSDAWENSDSDEDWAKLLADGEYSAEDTRPTERVYVIDLLSDGRRYRWTNASFIRVPSNLKEFP